jgi:phosphatidylglycerophosphate synthase
MLKRLPKWITPNRLTGARIFLTPFIILILILNFSQYPWYYVAFTLYVIAVILDILDGDLARLRNEVTLLGKILDPLADKLLNIPIFFILISWFGNNFCWLYLLEIIIVLEIALFIIAMFKHFFHYPTGANWFGKHKMGCEAGMILWILLLSPVISLGFIPKEYIYYAFLPAEGSLLVAIIGALGSIHGHYKDAMEKGGKKAEEPCLPGRQA